jgi:adenosine deaminase
VKESVRALAKAELHLHIEGTLEPELTFALAARNGISLPFRDVAALRAAHSFEDLSSFLALYYDCSAVLRTQQDFFDLAAAYLARAVSDGVVHAEIFFDPQAHLARGVSLDAVIGGLRSAIAARHDISALLIPCVLRDRPIAEAMDVVELLAPFASELAALGLDSAEVGHPPAEFLPVFEAASSLGLRRVAHAGEEGPPAYVWEAIDVLGVERIDHGIRCLEDSALVRRLATDQIPLTVCPLSNVRLRCVDTLAEHPLTAMLDAGLLVTLNSDDPAYFGGYVGDNYAAVQAEFGLSDTVMKKFADASLTASFRELTTDQT